jgi:hypothetical protein
MDAPSVSAGNDVNLLLSKYKYCKLINLPISSHSFAYKWMNRRCQLVMMLIEYNLNINFVN